VNQWGKSVNYDSNDGGVGGWWSVYENPQPCNGSMGGNCPPHNTGWYGGTAGSTTRGSGYAAWYGNNIPKPAHQFICSKCHTPHASGLPALLTTNCLDVGMSNWSANSDKVGPNADGTGAGNYWRNGPNNCHRNRQGSSRGWHKLAPMQNQ
jgi:predicted CXXCH cytochrome family protein